MLARSSWPGIWNSCTGCPELKSVSALVEKKVSCPYCGEMLQVLVELAEVEQQYIEDCQVCCRPIVMDIAVDSDGDVSVSARAENE